MKPFSGFPYSHPRISIHLNIHENEKFTHTCLSAWSRSQRISSISSSPMLKRMKSGETPASICCCLVSWLCVVVAGWMARLLASPTLATWLKSLQAVNEFPAGRCTAFDAKAQNGTATFGKVFLGGFISPDYFSGRDRPPMKPWDVFRGIRPLFGVLDMAFHPKTECFQSLQEQEGIEWGETSAEIAKNLYAGFGDKGCRCQHWQTPGRGSWDQVC